jgi:hypothetical protein
MASSSFDWPAGLCCGLIVAKYMIRRHGPSSQPWRPFLRNHAPDIAAMDIVHCCRIKARSSALICGLCVPKNSDIMVMQSAKDRVGMDTSSSLNWGEKGASLSSERCVRDTL